MYLLLLVRWNAHHVQYWNFITGLANLAFVTSCYFKRNGKMFTECGVEYDGFKHKMVMDC